MAGGDTVDTLLSQLETLKTERDEYRKLYEMARLELERLRRQLFGKKGEHVDAAQIQLAFDSFKRLLALAPPAEGPGPGADHGNGEERGKKNGRKPHGRQKLPEHLPVERIVLEPEHPIEGLVSIGEEVSEKLEWRRGSWVRLQIVRPKYADPKSSEQGVTTAEPPMQLIDRCLAGPALLAHVVVSKYCDHLPLERQETIYAREGICLAKSTMCGWLEPLAARSGLGGIVETMERDALTAHCIASDATGVLVQAADKCRRGSFWVLIADRTHVLFKYTPRGTGDGPRKFLAGFKGYFQADASSVYHALYRAEDVIEVGCWAHARRNFFEALGNDEKRALVGLGFINHLFTIERETKTLPTGRRTESRRAQAVPVLDKLAAWRDAELERGGLDPPVARALNYLRNHWVPLTRFLDDGRLRLDNNPSELELRRLVIGRKNWLFVGNDDAAQWTCVFVSLIASCKLHGLDPEAYLRDVIRVRPFWPDNRLLELAPNHWSRTRARIDQAALDRPFGHLDLPEPLESDDAKPSDDLHALQHAEPL